ncbi:LIM domain only protein 7 isoform X4 [Oryzias latipes]|uniref:LIM domain only protein 7 isoform X4 n=1 Tax=Oryzias latipes TaxID=8090 RepID=UPI000CE258CF|nr:LIM domain only protein 7 isoform X4 [Oryzias latipes]
MEGNLHVRSRSCDVSRSEQLGRRAVEVKHVRMEWRQQTSISCADAFSEAQRWIEEVTGKSFGCSDFRAALENGILLCDLINQLKPGIIKRMNRLSTPIAGLDNVNVFLKACGKLGLNESQLFHPGDLQDLSTRVTLRHEESRRRLKNVLITIYWLGRKAQLDLFHSGPQLNFKAFEGLLGLALSKTLEDGSNVLGKDEGHRERHELEREERRRVTPSLLRGNSVEHIEFLQTCVSQNDEVFGEFLPSYGYTRALQQGCGSDAESEQVYRMEDRQSSANRNKGYIPTPLRKKQVRDDNARSSVSPLPRISQIQVRPNTPVQVNPGWIWSKSLSDIPMVYPVRKVTNGSLYGKDKSIGSASEWNQDKRCSVAAKDSEAQWQDDLKKWKTRRRSGKFDLLRSSQDREHVINQMTNGAMADFEQNEAQGPIKRLFFRDQITWKHHSAPSPYSISPPSKASGSDFRPHTRAPLSRSHATELPSSSKDVAQSSSELSVKPQPASDQSTLGEDAYIASLASEGGVTAPSVQQPFTSQTQAKTPGRGASHRFISEQTKPNNASMQQFSSLLETTQPKDIVLSTKRHDLVPSLSSSGRSALCIESKENVATTNFDKDRAATTKDLLHQNYKSQEESQKSHGEPAGGATVHPAAGSSKYKSRDLSWSTSAGLPRGYRQSESCIRLSPAITIAPRPFGSKQLRVTSLSRVLSVEDSQDLPLSAEKNDSHCPPSKLGLKRQTAAAHLRGQYQASIRQKKASQAKQKLAEQRGDANNAAFSSQPSLQTTFHPQKAYTQTLPQPYTSLQYCSSSGSHFPLSGTFAASKAEHSDMRVTLTLKPNSVPDFGFKTVWDSQGARIKAVQPGSPAELCRLRADDEIVAVDGVAVMHLSHDLWKDKMASSLQTGTLTMDIRRYGIKDWSSNEENPQNQPAPSRMTLNLTAAAPVLIGCADRQTSAEMREAQESKLNEQSPNVKEVKATSGKLTDDLVVSRSKDYSFSWKNKKRREEFFNQKGGSESAISDLQVPSLRPSSSSWSWDSEEDRKRLEKWQEEQERLLQEQYQRDQERLEAEWQRAQQDAVEGRKSTNQNVFGSGHESFSSSQPHVNGWTKKGPEERQSPKRDLRESERKHQKHVQHVHTEKTAEKDWAKSLSTPALASSHRQTTGDQSQRNGRLSTAEKERRQILEEMKKRNQLLTDNSWIRQRNNSFYKDAPISLKRCESLDNLDVLHHSPDPPPALTYPRSNSATGSYSTPNRTASSRYSTGSMLSGRNAYMEHVSTWRTCCVCERILGSGAAMVIEALSLFFHYTCFQCVGCHRHLAGTKSRVQVRVRNGKLYCEHCYFQLKSNGAFLI